MNRIERKNILFRLIAGTLLLSSCALMLYALIKVIYGDNPDKVLPCIAIAMAVFFAILEAIFILIGCKKEVKLIRIAFNENGKINHVGIFGVGFGTLLGLVLVILPIILLAKSSAEPQLTPSFVILSIGTYLLINCIVYWIFIWIFKKRELTLEDYIK